MSWILPEATGLPLFGCVSLLYYSNCVWTRKNHRFGKCVDRQPIPKELLFPFSIGSISPICIAKHCFAEPHRQ